MTFTYATYETLDAAQAGVEDMLAWGEISECEYAGIKKIGRHWHVLLWA